MNFLEWMAVLGILLLILALASAFLRWLPWFLFTHGIP